MGVSANAALALTRQAPARPPQNWILTPLQDTLFVVAAPVITLLLALAAFASLGAADATTWILLVHVVMTVAHHTPTFIRIYGDVELFRRFKWTFVLGPAIPFLFALAVLTWLNLHAYPIENVLYLFILLTLWDPWHFLMQHYGFMRIYDRHNEAPRHIAARMDMTISVAWFVFIMLASGDWLAGVLEDLFLTAHIPLVLTLPPGLLAGLTGLAFAAASVATLAYGVYLLWCRRQGFYVSGVKLVLLATFFGVMFLTYTPNPWILALAPGWTFKVGFAVIGIVHMTQYLAIVWRYNRSLAAKPERARRGFFRCLHARGGWAPGAFYVAVCLGYGALLTGVYDNRWLMSVLLAAGFTSTLMHYYFDGFIWKLRHAQNSEQFAGAPAATSPAASASASFAAAATPAGTSATDRKRPPALSWWDASRRPSPLAVLGRQLVYFALPMAVLTVGALWVWNGPGTNYVAQMMRGQVLYEQGETSGALAQAESALASMQWQLPAARRLAELQPTAAREAAAAFLIYNEARYAELLLPTLTGEDIGPDRVERYRRAVTEAVELLAHALADGGPIGHSGREEISREDAYPTLASWRRELAGL